MVDILSVYEQYLGKAEQVWSSHTPQGQFMPYQVAKFPEGPYGVPFTTLTLSDFDLPQSGLDDLHVELLILGDSRFDNTFVVDILDQVATMFLDTRTAPSRGFILGPAGPITEGATVNGFFCSEPTYLPEEITLTEGERGPVLLVWLVPITTAEAQFLDKHGIEEFVELLEALDPDLTDFTRPSII